MKIKLFEEFANEAEKFTFKTNNPTGKWRSFDTPSYDIKLKGKVVGSISPEKPFKIRLMVMKNGTTITDNNPNCPWKWITLKKESETMDEAKAWLNEKITVLMNQWELHGSD